MGKIAEGIERIEDFLFSYFCRRNVSLVYSVKLLLIFFFGTIIPGYLFMIIEAREEEALVPYDIKEDREELLKEAKEILAKSKSKHEFFDSMHNILDEYTEKIIRVQQDKTFIENNRGPFRWTLWNSIVYAGTVYTTLGYGELVPVTTLGRLLTIIYALIGIPLFLVALANFAGVITLGIKYIWSYVRRIYYTGTCRKRVKTDKVFLSDLKEETTGSQDVLQKEKQIGENVSMESEETATTLSTFEYDSDEFALPVSLTIFLFIIYTILSALFYSKFEQWTYFEAFYFVVISLSTVGFGDYIPHRPFSQVCSILIIFFGLALCTMLIIAIQDYLSETFQDAEIETQDPSHISEESFSSDSGEDILREMNDESVNRIIRMELEEEGIPAKTGGIRINKALSTMLFRDRKSQRSEDLEETVNKKHNINFDDL